MAAKGKAIVSGYANRAPLAVDTTCDPKLTFAQRHPFMVLGVRDFPRRETVTYRFSNQHAADKQVAALTDQGFYARII